MDAFIALVKQMRDAQRAYFRDRTHTALQESKRLERAVDQWLKEHDADQPTLFTIEEGR